jgi:hypothetical protein
MRALKLFLAALVAVLVVHCGGDMSREESSTSSSELEVCVAQWSPTWLQRTSNEWWVEYAISGGTVAKAHLEVVSTGAIVPLSLQWGKWVGQSSARIAKGSLVIVHAETTAAKKAQTKPFGYLVVTAPVNDPCTGAVDAGKPDAEAGTDSGGTDAGACTNAWNPTWAQTTYANDWWVEFNITGGTVKSANLEVVSLGDVPLTLTYGKWIGPPSFAIPSGTQVVLHATNTLGQAAQTVPFRYLVDLKPTTKPCTLTDAGTDSGLDGGGVITPADVYDPNKVLTYEIGLDAAALAVFQSTLEADQKTWVHGTFKCGNVTFADVGVRRKGSSTFRALPQKAALKVKFAKYVAGQSFVGFSDLTLNNSMSDPTFLAERLSYHVFRSVGLPAQRAVSAQVTINGAPYGLYVNVETPNKQLNSLLFGANAKTLYEVNYGSDWLPGEELGFSEEVGDGTLADVTALFNSVQAAQNATLLTDMAGTLNTTEWLKFSAAEAAVGHYDGYAFGIWGSHNYFMAGDVNGRFSLIPWSTDLTMSNREGVVDANDPKGSAGGGPTLIARCKLTTACWNAYKAQVKTVLAAYETLDLVNLAKAWHAQIHPLVLADPKREASVAYYTSETALLYPWLAARPGVVRAQLGIAP